LGNPLPACLKPRVEDPLWAPPLDVYDAVVRLETDGITDAVAERDYGYESSWRLAEALLPQARRFPAAAQPETRVSSVVEYLKGISFSFSLLLCCLTMTLFHASLWGGDVSANMAAAVGLGTVSSFITTGGIVHGMARRGLFFIGVKDASTAECACWRWIRIGCLLLGISGVLLLTLARFYTWLPAPFDVAALGFHLSLGLLWLSTGLIHILDCNIWNAVATLVGTTVVLLLHFAGGMELAAAQIAGILVAAAFAFSVCFIVLRRNRRRQAGRSQKLSFAFDIYVTWPHFAFGAAYYMLVFSDRILAWTVPDLGASSTLQFRGDYETALDIALFGFILQVGSVRASTVSFFCQLLESQKRLKLKDRSVFIRELNLVYRRHSRRFLAVAALSSLALYVAVAITTVLPNSQSYTTLIWALMGFSALVFALWNTSLLFRLSQASDVLRSILPAILVNLVVGYALTRLGAYHYAAVGFSASTVCYAILTTRALRQRLQSLDYHNFSSAS
jgi:hypothetical protein